MKKKMLAVLMSACLFAGVLTGCGNQETVSSTPVGADGLKEIGTITVDESKRENKLSEETELRQFQAPKSGDTVAVMETSKGTIKIVLYPDIAPKAVENFVTLARQGYYDGVTFHRVIKDFMIQSGDPTGTGRGGESAFGEDFEDEFSLELYNFRGALSMANTGEPSSNSSQFFIVQADEDTMQEEVFSSNEGLYTQDILEAYMEVGGTPWLDQKHTVFGQVYEGMSVVDKLANVSQDQNGTPSKADTIQSVNIYTVQ